ncbi:hypothetical protein REPUB_Repub03eG0170000 [Reevesia pubescens]
MCTNRTDNSASKKPPSPSPLRFSKFFQVNREVKDKLENFLNELYEIRFNMKSGLALQKKLSASAVDFPRVNEYYIGRDILERRDSEYKAWVHLQSLKSCLDEQNLELWVKTANEAEAISQQRLAAAKAEIAELRQKIEASKRHKTRLSDSLKSKNEENEAYLSEIELVLEGVRTKQQQNALLFEKHTMEKEIQHVSASLDFYEMKVARIEDQLRFCSNQVQKLVEERFQNSVSLESTQKRLSDVKSSSHHQASKGITGGLTI